VVGLVGLQQASPGVPARPARPGHLPHQLERAFRRAQVGPLQAQVGVDHADQRQQRKVVPLGHDLRADDDVGPARGDLGDGLLQRAAVEEVRRQDRHRACGKAPGDSSASRSTPGPTAASRPFDPAGGAGHGHGFGGAALVADKALEEPVFHHPRVAMIAADLMPAGPADA
jgi:hypothetical protein